MRQSNIHSEYKIAYIEAVRNGYSPDECAMIADKARSDRTKQDKMAKAVRELAAQLRRRARCLT